MATGNADGRTCGVIHEIRDRLYPLRDFSRAEGMSAYVHHQFQFLGIAAAPRREAVKDVLSRRPLDWELVDHCWEENEREFQYVAVDHLRRIRFPAAELPALKTLITTKSWWDTVDHLAKVAGSALQYEPEAARPVLTAWATDDSLWVRRASILCQLGFKGTSTPANQTPTPLDRDMLTSAISANLTTAPTYPRFEEHAIAPPGPRFFLEKAIGWALRDVAHHDPTWVREFVEKHELAPLSRREALINLKP